MVLVIQKILPTNFSEKETNLTEDFDQNIVSGCISRSFSISIISVVNLRSRSWSGPCQFSLSDSDLSQDVPVS